MSGLFAPDPRQALPASTLWAWQTLTRPPRLPEPLYLAGDAALAMHLRHRQVHGLRFLYHDEAVDLSQLARELPLRTPFTAVETAPGGLRGMLARTPVEFVHADETAPQTLLEDTKPLDGLKLAGVSDLAAMKLGTIVDGGRLSDYYDLMAIEQEGGVALEDAVPMFLRRYRLSAGCERLIRLVNALGYLQDLPDDEALPVRRRTLTRWWTDRQARLVRTLAHTD